MTVAVAPCSSASPLTTCPVAGHLLGRAHDTEAQAQAQEDLLDELAHLLADVHEDEGTRAVAASVVAVLETWGPGQLRR